MGAGAEARATFVNGEQVLAGGKDGSNLAVNGTLLELNGKGEGMAVYEMSEKKCTLEGTLKASLTVAEVGVDGKICIVPARQVAKPMCSRLPGDWSGIEEWCEPIRKGEYDYGMCVEGEVAIGVGAGAEATGKVGTDGVKAKFGIKALVGGSVGGGVSPVFPK